MRNFDIVLQLGNRRQQVFQLFVVVFAAQFQIAGNLSVALFGVRELVLRENRLFARAVGGVVTDHLIE